MPDYIKIFASVWILLTCLMWFRGMIASIKDKKLTLARASFSAGMLWFITGVAPMWAIAMLWRFM